MVAIDIFLRFISLMKGQQADSLAAKFAARAARSRCDDLPTIAQDGSVCRLHWSRPLRALRDFLSVRRRLSGVSAYDVTVPVKGAVRVRRALVTTWRDPSQLLDAHPGRRSAPDYYDGAGNVPAHPRRLRARGAGRRLSAGAVRFGVSRARAAHVWRR